MSVPMDKRPDNEFVLKGEGTVPSEQEANKLNFETGEASKLETKVSLNPHRERCRLFISLRNYLSYSVC